MFQVSSFKFHFFLLLLQLVYEIVLFLKLDFSFYFIEEDSRFLFLSLLHVILFFEVFAVNRIVQFFHQRARNYGFTPFTPVTPAKLFLMSFSLRVLVSCPSSPFGTLP